MENTKIAWSHHTHNEWIGCDKVSPACKNCYAEELMDHRFGRVNWGKGQPRSLTTLKNRNKPFAWDRQAAAAGTKIKVFCSSLSDVFDDDKTSPLDEWRKGLFEKIEKTPNLYWLLLTKRPQNVMDMVPASWRSGFPEHVWLGASAENQEWLEKRMKHMREIPVSVRFLSCEPLLGPLDFGQWLGDHDCHACGKRFWGDSVRDRFIKSVDFTDHGGESALDTCPHCGYDNVDEEDATVGFDNLENEINWIIAGGESGKFFRPMNMDWVRSIRDQCVSAKVPFFLKQTSGVKPEAEPELDGRRWIECPEDRFALSV